MEYLNNRWRLYSTRNAMHDQKLLGGATRNAKEIGTHAFDLVFDFSTVSLQVSLTLQDLTSSKIGQLDHIHHKWRIGQC